MRTLKRLTIIPALAVLVAGLLAGCGDSTRNDQGVSFHLDGVYRQQVLGADSYSKVAYVVTPISSDTEESGSTGGVTRWLGLANYLTGQFVHVNRAHMSYYIPGSTVQPPASSWGMSGTLLPNSGTTDDEEDTSGDSLESTLPEGWTGDGESDLLALGQEFMAGVQLVPFPVMEWINLNRESLPEMPFSALTTVYVEGTTSAGHHIETNEISVEVVFTEDNVIPPTPAS